MTQKRKNAFFEQLKQPDFLSLFIVFILGTLAIFLDGAPPSTFEKLILVLLIYTNLKSRQERNEKEA